MSDGRQLGLQIRIGVFVLAALGVFLAIVYLLGAQARYFERKYDLVAEFTEVGGLIDGATVRLAGVQIGRVTRVVLPPDVGGKVRVTLTVARRFSDRIRRNSEARIVTQGLLGDRLVEISQGTSDAPPLGSGDTLASQDPFEVGRVFASGAETLTSINQLARSLQATVDQLHRNATLDTLDASIRSGGETLTRVNQLARSLQAAVDRLNRSGTLDDLDASIKATRRLADTLEGLDPKGAFDDLAATLRSARRITEEVETGKGWLHALIYEEPEGLRRLNALLNSAQHALARVEGRDSAVSVLLSPESGRAARALLAAMEAVGRGAEKEGAGEGVLSALLFDPEYKSVVRDLQAVGRNFRDVSERLLRGQGVLAGLLQDQGQGPMGQTAADFGVAMANIRVITDRLRAGEGTLGGLLEDPTVYENVAAFLEGAQRSFLLRSLIRSTIGAGGAADTPGSSGAGRSGTK